MAGRGTRSSRARRWIRGSRGLLDAVVSGDARHFLAFRRRVVLVRHGGGTADGLARVGRPRGRGGRCGDLGAGRLRGPGLCVRDLHGVSVSRSSAAQARPGVLRAAPDLLHGVTRGSPAKGGVRAGAGRAGARPRADRLGAVRARARTAADRRIQGLHHHRSIPACRPSLSDQSHGLRPGDGAGALHAEFPRLPARSAAQFDREVPRAPRLEILGVRIDVGALQLHAPRSGGARQHHVVRLVRHARGAVHAQHRRSALCRAGQPYLQAQRPQGLSARFAHGRARRGQQLRAQSLHAVPV